jgi:predicted DNA-binding protein (MmcQ/YjbR family)
MSRVISKKGKALVARVRSIVKQYPEVNEVIDGFGHTVFKVRKKSFIFVSEYEGKPGMILRLLHETQDFLVNNTDRYERSAYIGQHGWTSVEGDKLNWAEIEDLIDEAYRRTAPKTVIKKLNQQDQKVEPKRKTVK